MKSLVLFFGLLSGFSLQGSEQEDSRLGWFEETQKYCQYATCGCGVASYFTISSSICSYPCPYTEQVVILTSCAGIVFEIGALVCEHQIKKSHQAKMD